MTYDDQLISYICGENYRLYLEENPDEIDKSINGRGETAIILAAHFQCNEQLSRFLELGASVDSTDSLGNTALHHSVMVNNTEGCKTLLVNSANINHQNKRVLYTPLHLAINHGYPALASLLLENNAIFQKVTSKNENALFLAIRYNQFESFNRLLTYIKRFSKTKRQPIFNQEVSVSNTQNITSLALASFYAKQQYFDRLIKAGADPNQIIESLQVPLLHLVIYSEQPHAVERLLSAGSDPNITDADGQTALMAAVLQSQPKIITSLVAAHADIDATLERKVNLKDSSSIILITALSVAIQENNLEAGQQLLSAGATINSDDYSCTTRALELEHYDFFVLLTGGYLNGISGLIFEGEWQHASNVGLHLLVQSYYAMMGWLKPVVIIVAPIVTAAFLLAFPVQQIYNHIKPPI
nr:ankyrin repeat domain-containing protein [Endozoicomonas sp. OPT23]